MKYDGMMDSECIALCDALNSLPGIHTTESCCGHDISPFTVFFYADSIECLRPILEEIDAGQRWNWKVEAYHWSGSRTIGFCLVGPKTGLQGEGNDAGTLAAYILERRPVSV